MRRGIFHWLAAPSATVVLMLAWAACASNPASSSAVVPLEVPDPPPHEMSPLLVSTETPSARPAPTAEPGTLPETTPAVATPPAAGTAPSNPTAANPAAAPPPNPPGRPPAAELRPAEAGDPTISATQVRGVLARVNA